MNNVSRLSPGRAQVCIVRGLFSLSIRVFIFEAQARTTTTTKYALIVLNFCVYPTAFKQNEKNSELHLCARYAFFFNVERRIEEPVDMHHAQFCFV